MATLQTLALPDQITDAGLVHLKGLTNLQQLNLRGTKVTSAGVVALQQATDFINRRAKSIPSSVVCVLGLETLSFII